jgi:hypothetical protein
MKTRTLFLIFSLFAYSAIGQNDSISADTIRHGHKNVVKFLPVNLFFNSASFEYERKISPKNSLILGVGIPMPKAFADKYNLGSPENRITDDSFGTMAIRLAYRHYTGHSKQPSGFYISPYLKYQSFDATATNHKTPSSGSAYVENYDLKGNTMSLGFQMGWQFLIAKTVSIDFYFLGIEAGLANVDATVKSPDANMIDEIYTNVSQNIGDLPAFLSNKITVTKKGSNQVDIVGSSMPYPWLRSGISIGIAF